MAKAATMSDPGLHRSAVALYEALVRLVPDGADRVDLTLDDLVTAGNLRRRFARQGSAVRAWRYLRQLGAVRGVGRNGKVPVAHPDELTGDASRPARGRGGTGQGRGRGRRGSANAVAAAPAMTAAGSASVLAGAVETFTTQVRRTLEQVNELRTEIGVLDRQMGTLEAQHNRLVNELVEFRDALRDDNLASFFDRLVGDELWVYEERADPADA